MARRPTPPASPFPEFDDNEEFVVWPPDHIGFGIDAAALDATVGWLDFGDARGILAKVRAMVAALTEDGSHIAVANPSGQVGCFTADRWASILFVTRRSQQVRHRDVVEYGARGRDMVRIIGSESPHFCTAYVGLAFSISGNDPVTRRCRSCRSAGARFIRTAPRGLCLSILGPRGRQTLSGRLSQRKTTRCSTVGPTPRVGWRRPGVGLLGCRQCRLETSSDPLVRSPTASAAATCRCGTSRTRTRR